MLPICLITALPAETRPLTRYFGLSAMEHPHLRLYKGDVGYLLQCGVGKLNAAANTAAMLQHLPDVAAVINVGIAGSEQTLGKTLVAHSIQDMASEQQWYPHLPSLKKMPGLEAIKIVTVDSPNTSYQPDLAYDMEASGVYCACVKILDTAFIHSIKVISDNSENRIENINAQVVTGYIHNAIPYLEQTIKALSFSTLPESNHVNVLSQTLTEQIHYTSTEKHALTQLLHRYNALSGHLPDEQALLGLASAKLIRQKILSDIAKVSIHY